MPFDEEDDNDDGSANKKIGIKNASTKKSMFDSLPKKPNQQDFEKKVQATQQQMATYKQKASELAIQFKKTIDDKTLPENKNIFSLEIEKELLGKMVQLAAEINNDPNEQEGMGSLSWITLLLKTNFAQRDRINILEYKIFQLENKINLISSSEILKEKNALDKTK
jgi:hypothetical protein